MNIFALLGALTSQISNKKSILRAAGNPKKKVSMKESLLPRYTRRSILSNSLEA